MWGEFPRIEPGFEIETTDFVVEKPKFYSVEWKVGFGGSVSTAGKIKDGIMYFGCCDHYVYAVDCLTGKEVWRLRGSGSFVEARPFMDGDFLYIGCYDGCMYKIDTRNGELVWKFRTGDRITASAMAHEGKVYFGSFDNYVYAVDGSTGKELWRFRTGGSIIHYNPFCIRDDIMYVASYDRNMYALDVKNRRESWRFKAGWIIGTDPVIDGNIVYFGSWDQNMYAVDITTGREVWKFRAENIIDDLKPLIHDGIIYFGSVDSNMYAVSAGEGKLLWKFRTGGDIWSDAVHWNGLVIFGSWDCHLYAVDAKTGKEAWRFQTSTRTQSPLEMAEQIIVEPRFREKTGSGGKQGDYGPHPDIDLSETVYSIRSEYSGREVYGAGKKDYKAV